MARSSTLSREQLERELESLLDVERLEPPEEFRANARISDPSVYDEAGRDPERWWETRAAELDWFEPWHQVLDWSKPPFAKWFVGGKLNASVNCLDRHVEAGRGDRVAYHWRGEEGEERDLTYADLLRDVKRLANVLRERGIEKGDVVGIYLPMIPELVVAMLACARIGAPHNVVFGGFSPEAVRERMEFSEAKALITADASRRKGRAAPMKAELDPQLEALPGMETVIVVRNVAAETPGNERLFVLRPGPNRRREQDLLRRRERHFE